MKKIILFVLFFLFYQLSMADLVEIYHHTDGNKYGIDQDNVLYISQKGVWIGINNIKRIYVDSEDIIHAINTLGQCWSREPNGEWQPDTRADWDYSSVEVIRFNFHKISDQNYNTDQYYKEQNISQLKDSIRRLKTEAYLNSEKENKKDSVSTGKNNQSISSESNKYLLPVSILLLFVGIILILRQKSKGSEDKDNYLNKQ